MNSMQQLWFYGYHLHLDYMLDISYPGMNDDKQFHGEIVAPFSVTLWLYDIWNIQMRLLPLTDDCAFVTVACATVHLVTIYIYLLAARRSSGSIKITGFISIVLKRTHYKAIMYSIILEFPTIESNKKE